ncbi:MAG: ankyrin repeat domain-containing protein [Pseudomonadota bacterium]
MAVVEDPVQAMINDKPLRLYNSDINFHTPYLHALAEHARSGLTEALDRFRNHCPRFRGASDEAICAGDPSLIDALMVTASEHGFEDWTAMELHCKASMADPSIDRAPGFYRGVENNELELVSETLAAEPELVNIVSSTAKAALHKAQTPEMVELLFEHGVDPTLEAPLPGGTGMLHAIVWGFSEVADTIANHDCSPANLRVAAGLGDIGMIDRCFTDTGDLTEAAVAGRAYYRPNYGWYPWEPTDDLQEILDEALILAATNGRVDALGALVSRGADVNGIAYETPAIIRAAWKNEIPAIEWLLANGAGVDQLGWLGGHAKGVTALHIAASSGHAELVEVLLAAGADRSCRDDLYHADAAGWARFHGSPEIAERLETT